MGTEIIMKPTQREVRILSVGEEAFKVSLVFYNLGSLSADGTMAQLV
jgi:hypothetical protein